MPDIRRDSEVWLPIIYENEVLFSSSRVDVSNYFTFCWWIQPTMSPRDWDRGGAEGEWMPAMLIWVLLISLPCQNWRSGQGFLRSSPLAVSSPEFLQDACCVNIPEPPYILPLVVIAVGRLAGRDWVWGLGDWGVGFGRGSGYLHCLLQSPYHLTPLPPPVSSCLPFLPCLPLFPPVSPCLHCLPLL